MSILSLVQNYKTFLFAFLVSTNREYRSYHKWMHGFKMAIFQKFLNLHALEEFGCRFEPLKTKTSANFHQFSDNFEISLKYSCGFLVLLFISEFSANFFQQWKVFFSNLCTKSSSKFPLWSETCGEH